MAEITLDGDLAIAADVDGQDVAEVTIDGCVITFEKLYRSGYFAITGGSGSKDIPLPDSNYIMEAGIRFRGRSAVTSTLTTAWGDYCDTGWTTSEACCSPPIPPVPEASYGCQNSGPLDYGVRTYFTSDEGPTYVYATGWIDGVLQTSISTIAPVGTWSYTPTSARALGAVEGCVRHDGGPGQLRGRVVANTRYSRTCYSADTTMATPGGSIQYPFILSSGSKSPNTTGSGVIKLDDDYDGSNDLFWIIYLPWELFTAGGTTTLQFTEVLGSGNVDIEVFVVYR